MTNVNSIEIYLSSGLNDESIRLFIFRATFPEKKENQLNLTLKQFNLMDIFGFDNENTL